MKYPEYICPECGRTFTNRRKHRSSFHKNIVRKLTDEEKRKISESMKRAHAEGRASSWIGRRKLSYAEQSWYNIFTKDLGEGSFKNNFFVKPYWLDFAWPDKKIYFEVDGRTHYTKEGLEHDRKRTDLLKEQGWMLIGRCNWSSYKKLSDNDKQKYVQNIEHSIKTSAIIDTLIMKPSIIEERKAVKEGRKDKNGYYNSNVLLESEWEERKNKIINSGVDLSKFGWRAELERKTELTKRQISGTINRFSDYFENIIFKKKIKKLV